MLALEHDFQDGKQFLPVAQAASRLGQGFAPAWLRAMPHVTERQEATSQTSRPGIAYIP